jgi:hypothetical protein
VSRSMPGSGIRPAVPVLYQVNADEGASRRRKK